MKSSAPPPAPSATQTAEQQAAANKASAITQQQVNMVDQNTPYGSQTYTQNGTWADGTPKFTSNVTLSPQEQAKQEQQWKFDSLVNDLGINQTQKLTGILDKPVSLNNDATESRLMELGSKRLDPQFERQWASKETDLLNRGIMPGSEAYNRERQYFDQAKNDAYNQLMLTGRQQSINEILAERNQPINETTALMSGGQVQQPNFQNTPTAQVASPDVAGMTYQSYQMGPLAAWQNQQANKQAMMGGLFGLGGAALGGWGRSGFKFG